MLRGKNLGQSIYLLGKCVSILKILKWEKKKDLILGDALKICCCCLKPYTFSVLKPVCKIQPTGICPEHDNYVYWHLDGKLGE